VASPDRRARVPAADRGRRLRGAAGAAGGGPASSPFPGSPSRTPATLRRAHPASVRPPPRGGPSRGARRGGRRARARGCFDPRDGAPAAALRRCALDRRGALAETGGAHRPARPRDRAPARPPRSSSPAGSRAVCRPAGTGGADAS
jgi:hypothetical protein